MSTERLASRRWCAAVVAVWLGVASCAPAGTTGATSTATPGSAATTTTLAPPTTASAPDIPETTAVASTTNPTTTTVSTQLTGALPRCDEGAARLPPVAADQVGFIAAGAVYVADPDGSDVSCAVAVQHDRRFVWGPAGDRLVAGEDVILPGGSLPTPTAAVPAWSRPTGTSLVWVDGGRLLKAGVDGTPVRDLTFLASHDAVVYHPAGAEIATTGQAADETAGVWLSSNEGDAPRLIVRATEATVSDFTFNHDGLSAYFLADHGDTWHVHEIFLVVPEDDPAANEFDATIHYESAGPLSQLVVSPWDAMWAVQEGVCGSDARVVIGGAELPSEVADVDAVPVGWLPDTRLVVATYPEGCDGPADLWVVDVAIGRGPSAALLVSRVDGAAIRAPVPEPPQPLGDVALDEFA